MTGAGALAARLGAVRERMGAAAERAGRRPEEVALVGVAKRKPPALVAEAVRAGLDRIGENYLQEAEAKIPRVEALLEGFPGPRWHFVGRLQRNKAGRVARLFGVVESVDREGLGRALARGAAAQGRELEVLLQVNLSGEARKGGVEPDALPALLESSQAWPGLRVTGLMTVPEASGDPEAVRPRFSRLRELRDSLRTAPGGAGLRELSMGMSADFEAAIEEGATIVRIGTAIFGPREG